MLRLGVYASQSSPAANVRPGHMISISVNAEVIKGGVPILAVGGVVGRVDCMEGTFGAVIILVEENMVSCLVRLVRHVERLGFLEVGPGR